MKHLCSFIDVYQMDTGLACNGERVGLLGMPLDGFEAELVSMGRSNAHKEFCTVKLLAPEREPKFEY